MAASAEDQRYGPGAVRGYPLLVAVGAELGVAFVDLTTAFEGISERIYRDACCHYLERGYHLLAAEALRGRS